MTRVLIVDDSAVVRQLLTAILESDPDVKVVGTAVNGAEALGMIELCRPDVVTMDIHMPQMDGYAATRRIMETHPLPVVVVSASFEQGAVDLSFRALEAGAVAVMEKPCGLGHIDHDTKARELVQTVKAMAAVKLVKRRAARSTHPAATGAAPEQPARQKPPTLIAIGASTGGPVVIQRLLSALPANLAVPVLVVQHIAAGFVAGFARWLADTTALRTAIPTHGETAEPGIVYLAPDDFQMGISAGGQIIVMRDPPENHLRPAVSYLFRSVAKHAGASAIGVLLTGMGRDGAEELKQMKDAGATTFAQDEQSSAIFGMPGEAVRLGAATHILPPDAIAAQILARLGLPAKQTGGRPTPPG